MNVKICGIKTLEAGRAASEAGAGLLGLVFYPPSPRYLSPQAADELVQQLRELEKRSKLVGLFVNVPLAEIAVAAVRYKLDYVQLNGDETPEECAKISRIRPVIRALRLPADVTPEAALQLANPFGQIENLILLLDTHKSGIYGGTGQTGNWEAARTIAQTYQTLLAGGLTPENVTAAAAQVQPWGVDVSSGVESAAGVKDLEKIKLFIENARSSKFDVHTPTA